MKSDLFWRVRNFMTVFGQNVPEPFAPTVPADEVIRNRCRWQFEETLELFAACFGGEALARELEILRCSADVILRESPVEVDLVEYADANADIRYVAYGNDIAAGIYSAEVDEVVADSNDSKSPPEKPGDKIVKGPNYKAPDIEGVLRKQGWKGHGS